MSHGMGQDPAAKRALLLGVAFLAGLAAAVAAGLRPPPPQPDDGSAGSFSVARAEGLLGELVGDGVPHPVGSPQAARVRERVLAELERLGLAPEVQEAFGCGVYGICATVRNVVARLQGSGPGRAVLLVAHYDSVPAGPGASDDGAGVAVVLEAARALVRDPPQRPVILLVDDGEEAGLVGAAAFLRWHRWAREVGAVVNLEARGTSGPSLLFQTSGDDLWLARLAGRALRRPAANSFFAEIYRRLPNDTDLSLFLPLETPGLNFAFVGDAGRYHTPLDDLARVSRRSLEHQGTNALAAVRALAAADLDRPPPGRAVFFDVLGLGLVAWPRPWSAWLALLAAALLAAGAARAPRRGGLGPAMRLAARGLGALAAAPVLGGLLALAAWVGLRMAGALQRPFVAHPGGAIAVAWTAGVAGAGLASALAGRRGPASGLRAGAGAGWIAAAGALSLFLPAASHLALVPALAAGTAALASRERTAAAGDVAVSLAAGAVLFPVAWLLPDAIGHVALPAVAALVALALAPLAPLAAGLSAAARRALVVALGLAATAGTLATLLAPQASAAQPEHVLVYYHQDADEPGARLLVHAESGRLPPAMRRAAPFPDRPARPLPWAEARPSFAAPAARVALAAPDLGILESVELDGRRRLRLRLVSPRGAADAFLLLPPEAGVESVAMGGVPVPPVDRRLRRWFGGWHVFRCLTLPPGGLEMELVLRGIEPVEAYVADQTPGLPPAGAAVLAARPPEAVPFQEGDSTLLTRRVRL